MCYQLQYDGPEESEDCLYVNVFTPVLDRVNYFSQLKNCKKKLPIVFRLVITQVFQ